MPIPFNFLYPNKLMQYPAREFTSSVPFGGKLINTKDELKVMWLDIWIEKTHQSAFSCLL